MRRDATSGSSRVDGTRCRRARISLGRSSLPIAVSWRTRNAPRGSTPRCRLPGDAARRHDSALASPPSSPPKQPPLPSRPSTLVPSAIPCCLSRLLLLPAATTATAFPLAPLRLASTLHDPLPPLAANHASAPPTQYWSGGRAASRSVKIYRGHPGANVLPRPAFGSFLFSRLFFRDFFSLFYEGIILQDCFFAERSLVNIFPSSRTRCARKGDAIGRGGDLEAARGALRADETRNFVIADLGETKVQSKYQGSTFQIFNYVWLNNNGR